MSEAFEPQGDQPSAPPVEVVPTSSDTPISARDAAAALSQYRWKRDAREERGESPSEFNDRARAALAEHGVARSNEELTAEPGGDQPPPADPPEAAEAAEELPPIEPPRSWSKEEKEEFNSYPRELQERLARREQERDAGLRRGQNETAELRKAVDAERQQMEQLRQQYEQALPSILATLQQTQMGEFSDIKTFADVEKLANEDWARYLRFDAHQKKVSAINQEIQATQQRQLQQYQSEWTKWAKAEDDKFMQAAPEMANKETAEKATKGARDLLNNLGFSNDDIENLWSGKNNLSLRDHRTQLLIRDAARYREAKAAVPRAAVPKPVPKVQRPGTPVERASDVDAQLSAMNKRLDSGEASWKEAGDYLVALRSAHRR